MKRLWSHPKHKQKFKGRYNWDSGERVFELVGEKTGRVISAESWQMMVKLGWVLG